MSTIDAETAQIRYAGFWRRLTAYLVDATITGIIFWILSLFGGIIGTVLAYIILIIYFIAFWAWLGRTPGKAALGVKIVRSDGNNMGIGITVLWFIGYIVSSIVVYIGFLMIAFHGRKRGLHDLIAGTLVIIQPSTIQELCSKEEFESSLAEMDEIQREYHGL